MSREYPIETPTLALAKKYTDNSIAGTSGTLAGKNCTIQSIVKTDTGSIVTFEWKSDTGEIQTNQMTVKDGDKILAIEFLSETETTETFNVILSDSDPVTLTIKKGYSPKVTVHQSTDRIYTLDVTSKVNGEEITTTTPNLKGSSVLAEVLSETENEYKLKITNRDGNEETIILTPNMIGKRWWVGTDVTRKKNASGEYIDISDDTVLHSQKFDIYLNTDTDFVFQRIEDSGSKQQWLYKGCIAGDDNYELWKKIPGNEGKTITEYFEFLSGEGISCSIVLAKPSAQDPTTEERHWYYYQINNPSTVVTGHIDNTAWMYEIVPLIPLEEIPLGKFSCYTGQMYINGEVTEPYIHQEGLTARMYWKDNRDNGYCFSLIFNNASGQVVHHGSNAPVFYTRDPQEGYTIIPVNIVTMGTWCQTMYMHDESGGVVSHEITIKPSETYGSFVEQSTFNGIIGTGVLKTSDKTVKGAINELYDRELTILGEKKPLNTTNLFVNTSAPTSELGLRHVATKSETNDMEWLSVDNTAESKPIAKDNDKIPTMSTLYYGLPKINGNREYTANNDFGVFPEKATNLRKYPMADANGYPSWVDSDTFFQYVLEGIRDKIYPVGHIIYNDTAISEEDVKSKYGGNSWAPVTGVIYGVGDQISYIGSVNEELPNIRGVVGPQGQNWESSSGAFWNRGSSRKGDAGGYGLAGSNFSASYGQVKEDGVTYIEPSQSVYKDGGHVKPKGFSTYAWKRMS